ncbi:MAG: mechanosensitive ion channel family protein [Desulfobacteraceae bacterium]|nr:mechanosensitive ion channel family protein [Desulfobacteraceae bacterium]MBC2749129.1 mechanosensitive ion channel family protein [Desulfobacteraceae bacterium]
MNWMSITLWNNDMRTYLFAMAATIATIMVMWLLRRVMIHYFSRRSQESDHDGYDFMLAMASRTLFPLLLMVSLYVGMSFLTIPVGVVSWISSGAVAAVILQAAIWANALVTFWLKRYQKQYRHIDPARMTTVRAVSLAARLVVILVAVILVLDNLPGVEITALVASLGIGGIAIALAVQSILSDLFASLSIILDKPFVLGDFIIVDTYMGTVEYIGLKTTRVRSLSGEQLVFANGDLLKSRIRNYKRMAERRVVFTLGVTYQTAYRHLKSIPGWIETIIEALDLTRFDRAHFQSFGDYALQFEIVYYVLDPDYNRYMDIQQAINLAIYQKFEAEKIDFAYPTQTVNLIDHQRIERYSNTAEGTVNRATHGAAQKA